MGRLYKEKKMRCLICHGEDVQTKQVREEIKVDKNIICIPIQTPVCHTCGERYYNRRTVRYLEEMERKLQSSTVHLQEIGKVLELME